MSWMTIENLELNAHVGEPPSELPGEAPTEREPELCLYRSRTISVLKRYLRLSIETGRLPSMLGNLHFRARVSSYPLHTFEDAVIFVLDVERSLQELDRFSLEVIARVILQEHTPEHAARVMQCASRSVERSLADALDELTKHMLQNGILSRSKISPKTCQVAKNGNFELSDWKQAE